MFYLPLSLFIFISLPSSSTILSFSLLNVFIPPSQFYYFPSSMFLFPPPQFYYFPSSFLNSLPLHNINLSPPPPHSFFILLLHNFYYFLSFLNSLPLHNINLSPPPPHLFSSSVTIFIIFPLNLDFPPPPQFHYFPSSTSTSSFILYIFPSTNTSTSYRPYIDPTLTPHRPNIDPRLNFFSTQLGE